jgi:hypothetical protein
MLIEILRGLLFFLIIVSLIGAAGISIAAVRIRFLMLEDLPDRHGLLSLRLVLPSELPVRYYARRHQWIRLMLAFFGVVAIGAFLSGLNVLIFQNPN